MSLFRIDNRKILPIEGTSFAANSLHERRDLQDMLKSHVSVIAPDVLVVAEEFREWDDSHRRIDLLGLDKEANLVVIELKRDEDGKHMELQALRYAAMISALTFSRLVEIYEEFLSNQENDLDARQELLTFLDWDEVDEDMFGNIVRIVLVAADFSKELCTTVMWLNDFGIDIRCVRIAPYLHNDELLLDVQTLLPLPEVADFQIRVREKRSAQGAQKGSRDFTKYNLTVAGKTFQNLNKRQMAYRVVAETGKPPKDINDVIPVKKSNLFVSFDGRLDSNAFIARLKSAKNDSAVKRYFTRADELFHYDDGKTYALTNQWGKDSVEQALDSLKEAYPDLGINYAPAEPTV